MKRFFVNAQNIIGASAQIVGDEAHHIINVLRMEPGSPLLICDGEGYEYEGRIAELDNNEVIVKIVRVKRTTREPKLQVILAQGLAKKADSFELVVQKSTELGVSRLVPLLTERTVVRAKEEKYHNRKKRWQRIALEAAKVSQRGMVPVVESPTSLRDFLEKIPRDILCLMPWEGEQSVGIGEVLQREVGNNFPRPVAILIGPEGGFSEEEVDCARRSGAVPVTLGPRILRTETAGIIALGIVLYELGDLGGAKGAEIKGSSACSRMQGESNGS
jgi:16S rRNA (uracil1498-N3)-methyltransferase